MRMTKASTQGRRLTVQGWQNLLLCAMGMVVLAGAVVGAFLLNRTEEVSNELIDEIQPARVSAYQLQAALRDQETAVRGYAITADAEFWSPITTGGAPSRSSPKTSDRTSRAAPS